jgi:hypothetical protein
VYEKVDRDRHIHALRILGASKEEKKNSRGGDIEKERIEEVHDMCGHMSVS